MQRSVIQVRVNQGNNGRQTHGETDQDVTVPPPLGAPPGKYLDDQDGGQWRSRRVNAKEEMCAGLSMGKAERYQAFPKPAGGRTREGYTALRQCV